MPWSRSADLSKAAKSVKFELNSIAAREAEAAAAVSEKLASYAAAHRPAKRRSAAGSAAAGARRRASEAETSTALPGAPRAAATAAATADSTCVRLAPWRAKLREPLTTVRSAAARAVVALNVRVDVVRLVVYASMVLDWLMGEALVVNAELLSVVEVVLVALAVVAVGAVGSLEVFVALAGEAMVTFGRLGGGVVVVKVSLVASVAMLMLVVVALVVLR